jgi:hypothetical protein
MTTGAAGAALAAVPVCAALNSGVAATKASHSLLVMVVLLFLLFHYWRALIGAATTQLIREFKCYHHPPECGKF